MALKKKVSKQTLCVNETLPKEPKKEIQRIPTGIEKFDELIEGGFVRESINMLTGDSGTGKSTFGIEFLYNGITRFGENGIYICFEEKKDEVYRRMLRFNWDLEKLEREGKFIYLEYTAEQIEKTLESGGGSLGDMIMSINAKRIVIDSLSAFTLLFDSTISKREALVTLFKLIRKWHCTGLLVSNETHDMANHIALVEEYEVDGEIIAYSMLNNKTREKYMEIFKMRGTEHSCKLFKLDIVTKKGIIIKNAE